MKSKILLIILGLSLNAHAVHSALAHSLSRSSSTRSRSGLGRMVAFPTPPQPSLPQLADTSSFRNAWGIDILLSTGGFGLGGFYRRQLSRGVYGFISLSISEAKDDREIEFIDPFTLQTFTPGKVSRFLVVPLLVGVQYRIFQDVILENFRPYLTAAIGPSLVYASPYVEDVEVLPGDTVQRKVDFFKALGRGHAHYTAGGYVGIGAFFGFEKKNLVGINLRYYLVRVGGGIASLRNEKTGEVFRKKNFGGFFITISFGAQY